MKKQNEIILETEMVMEQCRQKMYLLHSSVSPSFSTDCLILENALFEFTVLFYTHRTIWTQEQFWNTYTSGNHTTEFPKLAYKQMIKCTLINSYFRLYFCIEGALKKYFEVVVGGISNSKQKGISDLLHMYRELDSNIVKKDDDLENGLNILRCVRNSFHGDNGCFIFKYDDEKILFKNNTYTFYKNKPVSASYEFLRDFIPYVSDFYNSLFA